MNIFSEHNLTIAEITRLSRSRKSSITSYIERNHFSEAESSFKRKKVYDIKTSREIIFSKYFKKEIHKKSIERKTQVFFNFKGGTGKTSISFQTATHLSLMGFNVLAIDLDPQAHLTIALGHSDMSSFTALDLMKDKCSFSSAIQNISVGLDLIPANLSLTRAETQLSGRARNEIRLDDAIKKVRNNYDYIIIDTNPSINLLNFNALYTADLLNIVCETQPFSIQALPILLQEVKEFSNDARKNVYFRILPNKFDSRTVTSQQCLHHLKSEYGKYLTQNVIRSSEDFNKAIRDGLPLIFLHKLQSPALNDTLGWIDEFFDTSLGDFNLLEAA